MRHNFAIVDALSEIARKKNVTPAQLSIAWVSALGPHVIPLPGSSCVSVPSSMYSTQLCNARHAKRTLENCAGGDIELTREEIEEVNKVIQSVGVEGGRYNAATPDLWA